MLARSCDLPLSVGRSTVGELSLIQWSSSFRGPPATSARSAAERIHPTQPGVPSEAPIGAHPGGSLLDRDRCEKRVRGGVPPCVELPAQPGEDLPVPNAAEAPRCVDPTSTADHADRGQPTRVASGDTGDNVRGSLWAQRCSTPAVPPFRSRAGWRREALAGPQQRRGPSQRSSEFVPRPRVPQRGAPRRIP